MMYYILLIAFVGFQLPDKVIKAINYNIFSQNEKTFQAGTVPPNFHDYKSDFRTYSTLKNGKLIKSSVYDVNGKLIHSTQLKDGLINDFGVYFYEDNKLVKYIDKNYQSNYNYFGDTLVVKTRDKIGSDKLSSDREDYIITDTLITSFIYKRNKSDTIKTYNYLNNKRSRIKAIQATNDDTLGISIIKYDAMNRIIFTKYTHHRLWNTERQISIFCDKERQIYYDTLGLISRRLVKINCKHPTPDWEIEDYEYYTTISNKKSGYAVSLTKFINKELYSNVEMIFNEKHDVIKKTVERKDKGTFDTYEYVIDYG